MNSNRGRYPPGIGYGRGANAGNPNYPNNYYARNPLSQQQQQYFQRNSMQNHQENQQQQQKWLRRNLVGSSESKKVVQPANVDGSSPDWKAQLNLPPSDTRYKTEITGDEQRNRARKSHREIVEER